MIDYELIGKILEKITSKEMPKFDDEDQRVCFLMQETWNLAIEHAKEDVKAQINKIMTKD